MMLSRKLKQLSSSQRSFTGGNSSVVMRFFSDLHPIQCQFTELLSEDFMNSIPNVVIQLFTKLSTTILFNPSYLSNQGFPTSLYFSQLIASVDGLDASSSQMQVGFSTITTWPNTKHVYLQKTNFACPIHFLLCQMQPFLFEFVAQLLQQIRITLAIYFLPLFQLVDRANFLGIPKYNVDNLQYYFGKSFTH